MSADTWAETKIETQILGLTSAILLFCFGFLFFLYEIRQLSAFETKRKKLAAEISDKAKTELLARVSHELRTPIQSILGYGELLALSPLDDTQRRHLTTLSAQGTLLLRLVNDLVDLGALQTGRLPLAAQPFSPRAIAEAALAAVAPKARARGLAFTLHAPADLPAAVRGDATRVQQVLLNLLGNAVKFTSAGSVRLELSASPVGDAAQPEITLRFAVADTGPGLTPEEIKDIFEPLGRLHRVAAQGVEGAGLGLALARSLCEAMQGQLTLVSTPGRGSTFTAEIRLPLGEPPAPSPSAFSGSAPGLLPKLGLRVLIVEDNAPLRTLLAAYLHELGCASDVAIDGPTGLEAALRTPYDVVILDLALPGIDGLEVARRLRAHPAPGFRPPWILGLSAHAAPADRAAGLAAGMNAFEAKPISLGRLAAALAAAAGRPPLDSEANPPPGTGGLLASPLLTPHQRASVEAAYRHETAALLAEVETARVAGDWPRVGRLAHYLRSSAEVMGHELLRTRAIACEAAVIAADYARAEPAARALASTGVDVTPANPL